MSPASRADAPRRAASVDAAVERHRGALPDGPVADDAPLTLPLPLEPTHYALLGLGEQADSAAIAAALQRLQSAALTPPRLSSDERRLAAEVLGDPLRKAVYDAWLARERQWLARVAPQDTAGRLRRRGQRLAPLLPVALLLAVVVWWLWPTG
jgi:hypothetical protein